LKDSIVARRYAKSLVDSAKDEGEIRALFDEFRLVVGPLTEPEILEFWRNPGISIARKTAAVNELAARLETTDKLTSFLKVLAAKNRIKLLRQVFREFSILAREELGEITVAVESPFELTEEEKNDLSSILRRKLGKQIILEIRINDDLLAGTKITVGDRVMDGSLRMRLEKLMKTISS
jgi:F-type H+-transporting ATPase subunit delta